MPKTTSLADHFTNAIAFDDGAVPQDKAKWLADMQLLAKYQELLAQRSMIDFQARHGLTRGGTTGVSKTSVYFDRLVMANLIWRNQLDAIINDYLTKAPAKALVEWEQRIRK